MKVRDAYSHELLVTYPDETLGTALQRMSVRDIGRLPVVSRQDRRQVVGILRRSDMIRAYDMALTRRSMLRQRAQEARLGVVSGADVEEFRIEADSACDGQQISHISWPRDSVIASIRRGSRLMIPHGETVLQADDVLTVLVEGKANTALRQLSKKAKAKSS